MLSECDRWKNNPSVNPYSNRYIKIHGGVYNKLEKQCGPPNTTRKLDSDCIKWLDDATINPVTGRSIKKDGPSFKNLEKRCGTPPLSSYPRGYVRSSRSPASRSRRSPASRSPSRSPSRSRPSCSRPSLSLPKTFDIGEYERNREANTIREINRDQKRRERYIRQRWENHLIPILSERTGKLSYGTGDAEDRAEYERARDRYLSGTPQEILYC